MKKIPLIITMMITTASYSQPKSLKLGKIAYDNRDFQTALHYFDRGLINSANPLLYLWRAKALLNIEPIDSKQITKDLNEANVGTNKNEIYYLYSVLFFKTNDEKDFINYLLLTINSHSNNDSSLVKDEFKILTDSRSYYILTKHDFLKNLSISQQIIIIVQHKIGEWQKKGKYEKLSEFQERVNEETRKNQIHSFTQNVLDSIGTSRTTIQLRTDYDPENETFRLFISNNQSVIVNVPRHEAKLFDENFKNMEFNNQRFALNDNNLILVHFDILNPVNQKKYVYDSDNDYSFETMQLTLNFDKTDVDLPQYKQKEDVNKQKINEVIIGKSDVDINIPENKISNNKCFVLIFGNEDYTKYQTDLNSEANVEYGINDAKSFAEYANNAMGIPNENIKIVLDAISSVMRREIDRLIKLARLEKAEIIFYYAGHGFPDEKTKEGYLMPVDISGTNVTEGIQLSWLYNQFASPEFTKVTVFLDACFSGGGRNQGLLVTRGVKIKPLDPLINGKVVVFSATSGDQVSLPYREKQHGMFTYFLLKKLQETKGNVTYKELSNYVKDQVQLNSIKINYKEQVPEVNVSPSIISEWENWKIGE